MSSHAAIRERVRAAVEVLEHEAVPGDLRAPAFTAIYADLRDEGGPVATDQRRHAGHAASGAPLERLAKRFGIDPSALETVFDFDDDGAHLVISRSALHDTKATAMREVAILTVAARQGAQLEEWTSINEVRQQCDERGVLDRSNFANEVGRLDGEGVRFRGSGVKRELKMNQAGFESAASLVRRILSRELP